MNHDAHITELLNSLNGPWLDEVLAEIRALEQADLAFLQELNETSGERLDALLQEIRELEARSPAFLGEPQG